MFTGRLLKLDTNLVEQRSHVERTRREMSTLQPRSRSSVATTGPRAAMRVRRSAAPQGVVDSAGTSRRQTAVHLHATGEDRDIDGARRHVANELDNLVIIGRRGVGVGGHRYRCAPALARKVVIRSLGESPQSCTPHARPSIAALQRLDHPIGRRVLGGHGGQHAELPQGACGLGPRVAVQMLRGRR